MNNKPLNMDSSQDEEDNKNDNEEAKKLQFSLVLPVLFYEYLALSITKSLVPKLLIETFKENTYFAVGTMETVKGILAFLSCPLFGRLSDHLGRKYCLLVTVVGTTMPVAILAFTNNMCECRSMYSLAVLINESLCFFVINQVHFCSGHELIGIFFCNIPFNFRIHIRLP